MGIQSITNSIVSGVKFFVALALRLGSWIWSTVTVFWNDRKDIEKLTLGIAAFVAVSIALTYSWSSGWWFAWHSNWPVTYAACAFFLFIFLFYRLAVRDGDVRHSMEGVAAVLASLTLFGAGYWYFYERPGVPKLDVHTEVQVWSIGDGKALVRVEVLLKNVGSTVIDFRNNRYKEGSEDDRLKVDVGQVMPIDIENNATRELIENFDEMRSNESRSFEMVRTQHWPLRAKLYKLPEGEIEAGETERYYYKGIVPCIDGMVLASTVRVPKVGYNLDKTGKLQHKTLVWVAQSLSNSISSCA